jgi:hypothetical protein
MVHNIVDLYTDLCTIEVCDSLSLSLCVRLVFSYTGCTKVSLVGKINERCFLSGFLLSFFNYLLIFLCKFSPSCPSSTV